MNKSNILKAIVGLAIIIGGMLVILENNPEPPTGDINRIEPLPEQ
jgi:hypothetical protein